MSGPDRLSLWFMACGSKPADVSSLLSALRRLDEEELPGQLLLLEELNQEQQRELNLNPPSSSQLRTGVARDWPDARAVWSVCDSLASSHEPF